MKPSNNMENSMFICVPQEGAVWLRRNYTHDECNYISAKEHWSLGQIWSLLSYLGAF